MISSSSSNAHKEFVNRDFNASVNIKPCVALRKRPEDLTRAMFEKHPLMIEAYLDKLMLIAVSRSKRLESVYDRVFINHH